ncbi:MAG TPA: hypothetical protein VKE73_13600 [Myxococcota bacterium]|nr:hypothetical protein [Myxococcota bacterium]
MKTIRFVSLLIGVGLAVATSTASGDDALQIAGSEVGQDGSLTHRVAEVVGDSGPTTTPILSINRPRVTGSVYEISGTVEYSDVQGDGYLEMASTFPEGEEAMTRGLDPAGPLAKLTGSSGPRSFALPVQLVAGAPAPTRLDLEVVLPGTGHVKLSNLKFSGGSPIAGLFGTWWRSSRALGLIGGGLLTVVGATSVIARAQGRHRRMAKALRILLLGLGAGGLGGGAIAVSLGQPREVWLPLLLVGILAALLPLASRRRVRRRFVRVEL